MAHLSRRTLNKWEAKIDDNAELTKSAHSDDPTIN